MNKLLSAEFMRMFKSTAFKVAFGIVLVITLLDVISAGVDVRMHPEYYAGIAPLDSYLFSMSQMLPLIMAAVCSAFLGADYRNGTIRNKLVVGHSRISIYLSNLVVNIGTTLILLGTFLGIVLLLGIPLLGMPGMEVTVILKHYFVTVCALISFAAIFTLLGMLIHSKSACTTCALIGSFLMLMFVIIIAQELSMPINPSQENVITIEIETMDVDGVDAAEADESEEVMPVPRELAAWKRCLYEICYDFMPYGQLLQLQSSLVTGEYRMILSVYALGVAGIATVAGVLLFRKKELK